ncbi:MAG: AAA family ATPase [Candidatus Omnitrophica bacterium]|nr:AAA family ATPase [Candidatus Omnitrophota bacterium]
MKRQRTALEKLRILWELHWIKVALAIGLAISLVWPVLALSQIDSYQRTYLMALFAMTPIQSILYAGIFILMLYWLHYGGGSFSKISKGRVKGDQINVKWSDVIGMEEAKQEAWEVVELLKDHAKVEQIGGKVLRGVLLSGPPGCGKTYLAKSIATETALPFLSISGSEFIEVFVGTGPARVRKIFQKAQQLARLEGGCIIFIDELDAVGTSRGADLGFGAQTERNNTVNELLVQMDGLESQRYNVVVIGATNASESVLDPALLRPGRLDRKIYVDRPGLEDREKLYRFYLGKVKAETSIDIARLARRSVWKSPADIENIVKESALIATRNRHALITYRDLSEALERVDLGFKIHQRLNPDERRRVAYHEAGHLITTYLLHPTDDVFKASIVSRRGGTHGVVYHVPREELKLASRDRIVGNIKVALAGYVAEKLKCGSTSDGVSSDFQHAMETAHQMVWRLGMGANGFIGDYTVLLESWRFRGGGSSDQLSDGVKEKLNNETYRILQECVKDVEEMLRREEALLERFKDELLRRNELEYDDIEAIFAEYGRQRTLPLPAAADSTPGPSAPATPSPS